MAHRDNFYINVKKRKHWSHLVQLFTIFQTLPVLRQTLQLPARKSISMKHVFGLAATAVYRYVPHGPFSQTAGVHLEAVLRERIFLPTRRYAARKRQLTVKKSYRAVKHKLWLPSELLICRSDEINGWMGSQL